MQTLSEHTFVYFLALLIVSSVLALFTAILPKPDNIQKQKAAVYFRYFLIFSCLSYLAFAVQSQNNQPFSLAMYNLLILASCYALMLTTFNRFEMKTPSNVVFIGAVQGGVLVTCQLHLLSLATYRLFIDVNLFINSLIPLAYTLWQFKKQSTLSKEKTNNIIHSFVGFILIIIIIASLTTVINDNLFVVQSRVHFLISLFVECSAFLGFSLSIIYSLLNKLQQQVMTDNLTGAKNRNYFYDIANQTISRVKRHKTPASLIMCDIDHFKAINDTYGHVVGDDVLKQFSTLLQKQLRIEDCLIRIGGEEFVVLCPDIGLEGARLLSERLRRTIEEFKFTSEKLELNITASFGATNVTSKIDIEQILDNADKALYKSKQQGRNQVNYFVY